MELRPLRAFIEVVRQGGFSRAAQAIFATQSTVSKAVKQLELEIGAPLLERSGHRVQVTPIGEVVYRRGLKLLADREDLLAEIAELRGLKRGHLRLGLPPVGSSTLFAPLFAIYRQRYPGIDVRLVELGSDQLNESLRAGEIDFAGLLLPVAPEFDYAPIKREPLVVLISHDHALSSKPSILLRDLQETPFILFESGFSLHRIILAASRRAGFEPIVAAVSSQIDFMIELVGAGLGVTFLPRMFAELRPHPAVARVLLDEPGTEWSMTMAWRRSGYLPDAAQAWRDLLQERFGNGESEI